MRVHCLIPGPLVSPVTGEWCVTCDGPSSACGPGRVIRVPAAATPVPVPVETPGW